jgi:hypothetical protein
MGVSGGRTGRPGAPSYGTPSTHELGTGSTCGALVPGPTRRAIVWDPLHTRVGDRLHMWARLDPGRMWRQRKTCFFMVGEGFTVLDF